MHLFSQRLPVNLSLMRNARSVFESFGRMICHEVSKDIATVSSGSSPGNQEQWFSAVVTIMLAGVIVEELSHSSLLTMNCELERPEELRSSTWLDGGATEHLLDIGFLRRTLDSQIVLTPSKRVPSHRKASPSTQFMTEYGLGEDFVQQLPLLLVDIRNSSLGRHIYDTGSGRLGYGHATLLTGDEICLLAGATVPYILRPLENGHFQLIDETFINGCMFGKMWPKDTEVRELIIE
jgi:hypothetical protein